MIQLSEYVINKFDNMILESFSCKKIEGIVKNHKGIKGSVNRLACARFSRVNLAKLTDNDIKDIIEIEPWDKENDHWDSKYFSVVKKYAEGEEKDGEHGLMVNLNDGYRLVVIYSKNANELPKGNRFSDERDNFYSPYSSTQIFKHWLKNLHK